MSRENDRANQVIAEARTFMTDQEIREFMNKAVTRASDIDGLTSELEQYVIAHRPKVKTSVTEKVSNASKGLLSNLIGYLFMGIIVVFIVVLISYFNDHNFPKVATDYPFMPYVGLSIALPYLISGLLSIVRDKTEDKGQGGTSAYSGPHFFTQAELYGEKTFKVSNNNHWKKYYITFLVVSILIPIALIPIFSARQFPAWTYVIGIVMAPLSFLTLQIYSSNFLVTEEMVSANYEDSSYQMGGTTYTVGRKKLDFSISSLIFDFLFKTLLPILSIYCVVYAFFNLSHGVFLLIFVESMIILAGSILFTVCTRAVM
jgi:hypothetical protein